MGRLEVHLEVLGWYQIKNYSSVPLLKGMFLDKTRQMMAYVNQGWSLAIFDKELF